MTDIPRLRKRPLEADAAASGRAANELRKIGIIRQKVGRPPLRGSHSLRTWSSTGKPVDVVGLWEACLSSGGFGLYTSWTRWSMVAFSRTCRLLHPFRRFCHFDPPEGFRPVRTALPQ